MTLNRRPRPPLRTKKRGTGEKESPGPGRRPGHRGITSPPTPDLHDGRVPEGPMGIAFWIGMFLLNPPAAAGQDVRGARLEDAVELLHSDDIRVREEAEEALSQLPVFWIPALRALAASERDLE